MIDRWPRRVAALVSVCALATGMATSGATARTIAAAAGQLTGVPSGHLTGVPAGQLTGIPSGLLTGAELRAVRIRSITATDDRSLGLFVTVTFQGDVARELGQGDLAAGALALTLTQGSAQPAVATVDEGGGVADIALPAPRRGTPLRPRLTELVNPERQVSTVSAGTNATVIRDGNRVVFHLQGVALGVPATVSVKLFAGGVAGLGEGVGTLPPEALRAILRGVPTAALAAPVDESASTVAGLTALGSILTGSATSLAHERNVDQVARGRLASAIAHYPHRRAAAVLAPVTPGALRRELDISTAGISQLTASIASLQAVRSEVSAVLQATAVPAVAVVQTDPSLGESMATEPGLAMSPVAPLGHPVIDVDPTLRYQQFAGLGAAMTDSAAWLIESELSAPVRQALMQALFGEPGVPNALGIPDIHLSSLRIGVGAPGAMTVGAPYSYDDTAGSADPSLQGFSIAHDLPYMIPVLRQAIASNPSLSILASPWSPPAWMKSNGSLDNPSATGTLLPSAYGPFARYLVKFIEAYQQAGVPIDAITPENEPSSGDVGTNYPGMTFTEGQEAQFITQDLAPALHAAGLAPQLYGADLAWNFPSYAEGLAAGSAAADLTGVAWHCYYGSPTVMSTFAQLAPALHQIVDECSPEIRTFGTPEFLISSLRNWASAVSVWTVALDPFGGPIQAGNACAGCTGPVTITGQTDDPIVRSEYYQLGQVSAFVQPGAWRIGSQSFVTYGTNPAAIETVTSGLDDVAFQNPDGSEVLVAYNNSASPISFAVESNGQYFTATLPAGAMTTFTWA